MGFFDKLPLRKKLIGIITFTSAVGLTILFAVLTIKSVLHSQSDGDRFFKSVAEVIGINATPGILFQDQASLEEALKPLRINHDVLAAQITDLSGKLHAVYQRDDIGVLQKDWAKFIVTPSRQKPQSTAMFASHTLLSVPIMSDTEHIGNVDVMVDLSSALREIRHDLWIALGIAVLSVLAAFFVAAKLQGPGKA